VDAGDIAELCDVLDLGGAASLEAGAATNQERRGTTLTMLPAGSPTCLGDVGRARDPVGRQGSGNHGKCRYDPPGKRRSRTIGYQAGDVSHREQHPNRWSDLKVRCVELIAADHSLSDQAIHLVQQAGEPIEILPYPRVDAPAIRAKMGTIGVITMPTRPGAGRGLATSANH
jgi:hypothetical protein